MCAFLHPACFLRDESCLTRPCRGASVASRRTSLTEPLLVLTLDCLARRFGYNRCALRRLHARNTTGYAADCSSLVPNAWYRCVAVAWPGCRLARGKTCAWPRLRLHHGHYFGTDRLLPRWLDFYKTRNFRRRLFVLAGGRYTGSGHSRGYRACF